MDKIFNLSIYLSKLHIFHYKLMINQLNEDNLILISFYISLKLKLGLFIYDLMDITKENL